MKYLQTFILGMILLPLATALAHEGHGSNSHTLLHYLTEPLHLFGLVALLVGVVAIATILMLLRSQHR